MVTYNSHVRNVFLLTLITSGFARSKCKHCNHELISKEHIQKVLKYGVWHRNSRWSPTIKKTITELYNSNYTLRRLIKVQNQDQNKKEFGELKRKLDVLTISRQEIEITTLKANVKNLQEQLRKAEAEQPQPLVQPRDNSDDEKSEGSIPSQGRSSGGETNAPPSPLRS